MTIVLTVKTMKDVMLSLSDITEFSINYLPPPRGIGNPSLGYLCLGFLFYLPPKIVKLFGFQIFDYGWGWGMTDECYCKKRRALLGLIATPLSYIVSEMIYSI